MKAIFLTEYSPSIGFGHLARCSALAEEFHRQNYPIQFIIRGGDISPPLGFDSLLHEWNSYAFIREISSQETLLIFDTYRVSEKNLEEITQDVSYPIFIADSQKRYIDRGLVIFPVAYGSEIIKGVDHKKIDCLVGLDFILFRREFIRNIPTEKKNEEKISNVLISLGGFIKTDVLDSIISILLTYFDKIKIFVVGNIPDGSSLNEDENVSCLNFIDTTQYISLLKEVDFAVLNGGQSLNEAILLKTPAIAIPVADNQLQNLSYWESHGACLSVKPSSLIEFKKEFIKKMTEIESLQVRNRLSNSAVGLDGLGSKRIVDYLQHTFKS